MYLATCHLFVTIGMYEVFESQSLSLSTHDKFKYTHHKAMTKWALSWIQAQQPTSTTGQMSFLLKLELIFAFGFKGGFEGRIAQEL